MRIDVKNLDFSYGERNILEGISFSVDGPGLVAILGPNGVGKSTLIQCINRILQPTAGSVEVNGKPVGEYNLKELAKVLGYVPCMTPDSFPMSVADAVLLGRHPHSNWKSTRDDVRIVYEVLREVGIEDLAMHPFNNLSAGQHQKVMLARGLAQQTEILLLDEPTANLDVKHQLEVTHMLKRLSVERGILVIMICHDLNLAAKYADTVIMLKEGRIFAMGTVDETMTRDNISSVYGVDCEIVEDQGRPHIILREMEHVAEGDDSTAPGPGGAEACDTTERGRQRPFPGPRPPWILTPSPQVR